MVCWCGFGFDLNRKHIANHVHQPHAIACINNLFYQCCLVNTDLFCICVYGGISVACKCCFVFLLWLWLCCLL